ncbi:hypothetical protein QJS10_CPA16g00670 [Acorus calamus]|uniref:Uncharacterized protein n=1 Tax=Acorus calamus TaxID=4465 RepID=A0AAV9D1P2_ACOCL|nr:hypothetical protein QJS10_CPA16g00670 [Acorus calamus]
MWSADSVLQIQAHLSGSDTIWEEGFDPESETESDRSLTLSEVEESIPSKALQRDEETTPSALDAVCSPASLPVVNEVSQTTVQQSGGDGSRPVVFESGEAEFLGSPGCVKASRIGIIFKDEGERYQFKAFLFKSKQVSGATLALGKFQKDHS